MKRIRLMFSGSWPTLAGAILLVAFAFLAGASWPAEFYKAPPVPADKNPGDWLTLITFSVASGFLCIKNTLMLQRMGHPVDHLTIALVSANFAFSLLYLVGMARPLFGDFFNDHTTLDAVLTLLLRINLIGILGWGIWTLTNTPPGSGYIIGRDDPARGPGQHTGG